MLQQGQGCEDRQRRSIVARPAGQADADVQPRDSHARRQRLLQHGGVPRRHHQAAQPGRHRVQRGCQRGRLGCAVAVLQPQGEVLQRCQGAKVVPGLCRNPLPRLQCQAGQRRQRRQQAQRRLRGLRPPSCQRQAAQLLQLLQPVEQ